MSGVVSLRIDLLAVEAVSRFSPAVWRAGSC